MSRDKFTEISSITVYKFDLLCPPINSLTYKITKCLVPIFQFLTSNEKTVNESFAFVEVTVEQDSKLLMGNLDVASFCTNILLKENIDICTNAPFENTEK